MVYLCQAGGRHCNLAAAYIYPYSRKNSTHRQLPMDMCVFGWTIEKYRGLRDNAEGTQLPPEFFIDVVSDMDEKLVGGEPVEDSLHDMFAKRDPCKYHEHGGEDGVCYKKKCTPLF
jgi:hypothetical protein